MFVICTRVLGSVKKKSLLNKDKFYFYIRISALYVKLNLYKLKCIKSHFIKYLISTEDITI